VVIPGLTTGNLATESMFDSEAVKKIVDRTYKAIETFREKEYGRKLEGCLKERKKDFQKIRYTKGDEVFVQKRDTKSWSGPVKVFCHEGVNVWLWNNGELIKVNQCKVIPHRLLLREGETEDANDDSVDVGLDHHEHMVGSNANKDVLDGVLGGHGATSNKDVSDEVLGGHGATSNKDVDKEKEEEKDVSKIRPRTRSVSRMEKEVSFDLDKEKDDRIEERGATYLMRVERQECFDTEITTYVVEVPLKDHGKEEVVEAKQREIENLRLYDTFEEVEDVGQETIGSRWVITKKEKQDGQKTIIKARLVAKGFQENDKPQSDSPTVLKENSKIFYALTANEDFEIASVDIRAAFLQARKLDREVFMKPPKDLLKDGIVWKLLKPLYGLDDASRKFYIRVKEVFKEMGLKSLPGDEAFFYKNDDEKLLGMIMCHVDDFNLSGTKEFLEEMIGNIKRILTVSKVERQKFRFTGVDVEKTESGIVVSMEDYAESVEEIEDFRKTKNDEKLTGIEQKLYRKYVGKFLWLSENCRPDLAFTALDMAKKNSSATMGDLKRINSVIKRIRKKKSSVLYSRVGDKRDLKIVGIGDASFKCDESSVGGTIVTLCHKEVDKACPIQWKSRVIRRRCHSSKDAETRILTRLLDDALYTAQQVEILLYGQKNGKIAVKLFTDSRPTLESIASTKQITTKLLRNDIQDFKDRLYDGEIESFSWLDTSDMLADVLTKEVKENKDLCDLIENNKLRVAHNEDAIVRAFGLELRLVDPKVKEKGKNNSSSPESLVIIGSPSSPVS